MDLKNKKLLRNSCYINGLWQEAESGKKIKVLNKASGEEIGTVPDCSSKETNKAISAAAIAQKEWAALSPIERGDVLMRWYKAIEDNLDDLITILSSEQGKPRAEARGEILNGLSYIKWYAEEGRRFYGELIPSPWKNKQPIVMMQPVGVAGAISPWNFPSAMITRKASPALAAGCSFIIKPASATPYSAIALAALADEAGFIPGLFSVVTGSASEIGSALCSSPTVRALSFTGSTQVGKKIMEQCSGTVKKLALELGGNAPFIVFDKACMDTVIPAAMSCKFRNAGQTCICANRFFVQDTVHDDFVKKFVTEAKKLVLGNAINKDSTMGPLINSKAMRYMEELIKDALDKGAKLECGGKASKAGENFFEATVLTGVTPEMRLFKEEIFGPIAPIIKFSTEKEVIKMANDTQYGLASYLFTQDLGQLWRVSSALDFGMVGVNEVALASGEVPFGGVKESGLGREGGRQGLREYMEEKYILLGGLDR